MTNLETLQARIVKIVPEIMKLEFGCYVNPTVDSIHFVLAELIGGYVQVMEMVEDEGIIVFSKPMRDFPREILGRPIQLADVLQSVGDNDWEMRLSKPYILMIAKGKSVHWDIRLNLSEQSIEVIDFLLEVIPE